MGLGSKIAKRSLNFSKSYIGISLGLSAYGIGLANLPHFLATATNLLKSTSGPFDVSTVLPFVSVALLSLSGITISTPVILLFVYDKNNGLLEYLLSTGLDQMDLFTGYMKAALILTGTILAFINIANILVGLLLSNSLLILTTVSILSFVIGVAAVSFVMVSMMAFSSMQKTPMGANQPLGLVLGVIPVFPSFVLPIIFQSYAALADIVLALVVVGLSIGVLLLSSKLVQREKLLP